MQNTLMNYKFEATVATGSAITLGTTQTPKAAQISILQVHLVDDFMGVYITIGDFAALMGAVGVSVVMLTSLAKYIIGKFK